MSLPSVAAEVAFTADLETDPSTWTWTELAGLRAFGTQRGRSDERGRTEAGEIALAFDNQNRNLDPSNTASLYYSTYVDLPATADGWVTRTAPGSPPLGDVDVMMRVSADDWSVANQTFFSLINGTTGFQFTTIGTNLRLSWYEGAVLKTATATGDYTTFLNGETYWLRVWIDVDNDASGRTIRFYYSKDEVAQANSVTWVNYGEPVIQAGITSIDSSSALPTIGGLASAPNLNNLVGKVWACRVMKAGVEWLTTNFMFGWSAQNTTGLTNSAWTLVGTATAQPDEEWGSWVVPGRPVRLTATCVDPDPADPVLMRVTALRGGAAVADFTDSDDNVYRLFTGYIDAWPNVWPDGPYAAGSGDAVAVCSGADAFKDLANSKVTPYYSSVTKLKPSAYWRFDDVGVVYANDTGDKLIADAAGNEIARNLTGKLASKSPRLDIEGVVSGLTNTGAYLGALGSGKATLLLPETPDPVDDDDYLVTPQPWLPSGTGAFTIMGWIQPDTGGITDYANHTKMVVFTTDTIDTTLIDNPRIMIYINVASQKLKFLVRNGSHGTTEQILLTSTTSICQVDGLEPTAHFFVCSRSAEGFGRLYIDGVLEAQGRTASPVAFDSTYMTIGGLNTYESAWGSSEYDHYIGFIDEVALFSSTEIMAKDVTDLHTKALASFYTNSLPHDRIDSILDVLNWPASLRDIDTTASARLVSFDSSDTAVNQALLAAEADDGELFIDEDGVMVFKSRYWKRNSAVTDFVFGDVLDSDELPYRGLQVSYTGDDIINEAIFTQTSGDSGYEYTYRDEASIKQFRLHSFSKSLALAKGSDTQNLAEEYVRRNRKPRQRVNAIAMKTCTNWWTQQAAFNIQLWDRITIKRTPPGGGDRMVIEAFVTSIGHRCEGNNPADWDTIFTLVDTAPYDNTWVLGTSVLGSTTTLAY